MSATIHPLRPHPLRRAAARLELRQEEGQFALRFYEGDSTGVLARFLFQDMAEIAGAALARSYGVPFIGLEGEF